MIRSFADCHAERVWRRELATGLDPRLQKTANRKLQLLSAGSTLQVVRVPPGSHWEALTGDRAGQHGIRIIEGFGITHNQLAASIGVPPGRINEIVHGKRGISADIERGRANGVTAEQMAEVLTHAAFYAGWPTAWAAFRWPRTCTPTSYIEGPLTSTSTRATTADSAEPCQTVSQT